MAMKKKKKEKPQPFAAETKDQRYAGTFEVLVPVEGRDHRKDDRRSRGLVVSRDEFRAVCNFPLDQPNHCMIRSFTCESGAA